EALALVLRVEHPHERAARCATRCKHQVRERRLGEVPWGTLGEVLFRNAVEVGSQKALPQVVASASASSGAGARNAVDERDAGGGDAVEQPIVLSGERGPHGSSRLTGRGKLARRVRADSAGCSWRVHTESSWSGERCRVRVAHLVQ